MGAARLTPEVKILSGEVNAKSARDADKYGTR